MPKRRLTAVDAAELVRAVDHQVGGQQRRPDAGDDHELGRAQRAREPAAGGLAGDQQRRPRRP